MQVLQNKVMRLKSGLPFRTSTLELTKYTGDLSVQQLTAYSTLVTANKALFTQQPQYLANKFKLRTNNEDEAFPYRSENKIRIQANLTIGRSGWT